MGKVRDAKNRRSAETLGKQMRNRRLLLEVRREAAEFAEGLSRNLDPADQVQKVLDNMADRYEYATQKVYELHEDEYWLDTMGGKVPHHWIREQERLALQIVHIAGKAAAMGIAERQVRIAEAQAALFARVVDQALIAHGVGADDRRRLHEAIAVGMQTIDGTAELVA